MRVRELTAFHVRIPLRRPVRHASHARTSTDNILVRCTLDDGTIGWGEGVPREYVTGETAAGALDLLRRSGLPAQVGACPNFSAEKKREVKKIARPRCFSTRVFFARGSSPCSAMPGSALVHVPW